MKILRLYWKIFVKLSFFLLRLCNESYEVVVRTKWGPVRGIESENGPHSIYSFRNIPYARQPVGDLRFELPKEVDPWNSENELNQRKEIYCPQSSSNAEQRILGQENCLFLDIYAIKTQASESCCFPVLVYFHDGRFSRGSKEEHDSDFLLRNNKFIVVIPNYRLGILGFLSTQDYTLPGNLGLWDQRMALKWVAETIEIFGGDPHKITIAGHDAGGASVGFHILSPLSHNYFSAAISSSGTALDPWVMNNDPSPSAVEVAKEMNCTFNSSKDLVSCLKRHNFEDILHVQVKLKHVAFLPTKDETAKVPFIPAAPRILYEKGYQKNVSYLAGVTENRAALEVSDGFPAAMKYQHLDKMVQYFLRPYMQHKTNFEVISKAVKYHYLKGAVIPSFASIEPILANMMSDFLYVSPLHHTLKLHSKTTPNTFMYILKYEGEAKVLDGTSRQDIRESQFGINHMEYERYLFNKALRKSGRYHNRLRNKNVIENLCKIWGNFIKLRFLPQELKWKQFGNYNQMNYAEISEIITPRTGYRRNEIEFWTLLVPDLDSIQNLNTEFPEEIPFDKITSSAWSAVGLAILFGVLCVSLVGVVVVTRSRMAQLSILPISSPKEDIKYSNI